MARPTQLPEQVDLNEGLEKLNVQERLQESIEKLGMKLPNAPVVYNKENGIVEEYYGQLPEDLTQLTDLQLYEEMEKQTKWLNYVNGELSKADIQLTMVKRKEKLAKAKIRLSYRVDNSGDTRTQEDARDMQECDRVYVGIQSDLLYWEALVSYITAIKKAGEDSYALLSRRVTQRGQELERDRRTAGAAGAFGSYQRPQRPNGSNRRF